MEIKIKILNENAIIPTRGSAFAAGYDLYANINETVIIKPHETAKIETGLCVEIPDGYFGGIVARSGLATKKGLAPVNKIGIVDSDFRGNCIVALHNDTNTVQVVEPNERIAQLVVIPYLAVEFLEVDNLSTTERGSGCFGSTGVK